MRAYFICRRRKKRVALTRVDLAKTMKEQSDRFFSIDLFLPCDACERWPVSPPYLCRFSPAPPPLPPPLTLSGAGTCSWVTAYTTINTRPMCTRAESSSCRDPSWNLCKMAPQNARGSGVSKSHGTTSRCVRHPRWWRPIEVESCKVALNLVKLTDHPVYHVVRSEST